VSWIAEQAVVFVWPDGRRVEGRIAVGTPEDVGPEGPGEARCSAAVDGLYREFQLHGASQLQALVLAIGFLQRTLTDFASKGGRVLTLDPRGEVDALAGIFGSLQSGER